MAQQRVKTVSAFIRREMEVSTSIWNYKTRCYWDKVDAFLILHKERMGGTDSLLRTGDEYPEHTPHALDLCWESMRTQQADSYLTIAYKHTQKVYPTRWCMSGMQASRLASAPHGATKEDSIPYKMFL